jgi:hypothetical protein
LVYDTIDNITSKFSRGTGEVRIGFARPVDLQTGTRISNFTGVTSFSRVSDRQMVIKFDPVVITQEKLFEMIAGLKAGAQSLESASGLEDAYLSLVKETL